jgi:hypothetical protein
MSGSLARHLALRASLTPSTRIRPVGHASPGGGLRISIAMKLTRIRTPNRSVSGVMPVDFIC